MINLVCFFSADAPTLRQVEPSIALTGDLTFPKCVCSFTGKKSSTIGLSKNQIPHLETEPHNHYGPCDPCQQAGLAGAPVAWARGIQSKLMVYRLSGPS